MSKSTALQETSIAKGKFEKRKGQRGKKKKKGLKFTLFIQ